MQEGGGDFAFQIRNVAEVCERIEYYEFKQKEALNFDILEYLLTKQYGNRKCEAFVEGISLGTIEGNNFIKGYISRNSNLPCFIKTLCHKYTGFIKNIVTSGVLSEITRYHYYTLVLEYADLDDIEALDNFENYVFDFVIAQDTNLNESIVSVEDILERLMESNIDICKDVIDKFEIIWEKFPGCCIEVKEESKNKKQLCEHILKNNKIKGYWQNYLFFYNKHGITDALVKWFDYNVDAILEHGKISEITDGMILELLAENISMNTFEKVVKENQIKEFNGSIEVYNSEKLSILIENEWIPFTLELFKKVKSYGREILLQYTLCYKEEFFAVVEQVVLEVNELAYILAADDYNEQEKVQLLDMITPEKLNVDIAKVLRNIKHPIKKEYVEAAWDLLVEEERYELLLNQLNVYTVEEISVKFSELASVYKSLSDISRKHKVVLPATSYNKNLLEKLLEMQYITSFEEETNYKIDYWTNQKCEEQKYVIWVKQKTVLK